MSVHLTLPLQVAAGAVFAASVAVLVDLLGAGGRRRAHAAEVGLDPEVVGEWSESDPDTGQGNGQKAEARVRYRLAAQIVLFHVLGAVSGVYLSITVELFRPLFGLGCWLYGGYLAFWRWRGPGRPQ